MRIEDYGNAASIVENLKDASAAWQAKMYNEFTACLAMFTRKCGQRYLDDAIENVHRQGSRGVQYKDRPGRRKLVRNRWLITSDFVCDLPSEFSPSRDQRER
jgi:hypothetical protein